jgi:hypothetical protein
MQYVTRQFVRFTAGRICREYPLLTLSIYPLKYLKQHNIFKYLKQHIISLLQYIVPPLTSGHPSIAIGVSASSMTAVVLELALVVLPIAVEHLAFDELVLVENTFAVRAVGES